MATGEVTDRIVIEVPSQLEVDRLRIINDIESYFLLKYFHVAHAEITKYAMDSEERETARRQCFGRSYHNKNDYEYYYDELDLGGGKFTLSLDTNAPNEHGLREYCNLVALYVKYIGPNEVCALIEDDLERIRSLWSDRLVDNERSAQGPAQQTLSASTTSDSTGHCYIATAVYGSYDCAQVRVLRRFRDEILANHFLGRSFIHLYYAVSPTLVKWFKNSDFIVNLWRKQLNSLVQRLKEDGIDDAPYTDVRHYHIPKSVTRGRTSK